MQQPFRKKSLLAVEGEDEVKFFAKLLGLIGILKNVDIRKAGGKDQFKGLMQAFTVASGFRVVERIAVIRDADENAAAAFQSAVGVLKKVGLKAPGKPGCFSTHRPAVGVFIMPDNKSPGMLEDLCLDTVKEHEAMKCVDEFIACTENLSQKPRNIPKAKAQVFLASQPKMIGPVGLGAQRGYWNFESEKLQPLVAFLKQLI